MMLGTTVAALALAAQTISAVRPATSQAVASDGTVVSLYDYHPKAPGPATPVLMFHQAGGDARGELGPIAEKLASAGRRVFTADLRSGGSRFGGINQTAAEYKGPEPSYCAVYPDLVAALDKATVEIGGPVVVVGSSYSAALVVKLAAEHPGKIAGFVAFSPAGGDPMKGCEPEPYLGRLKVPGVALRNRGPADPPPWIATSNEQWAAAGYPVTIIQAEGHGASLLLAERTKGDVAAAWKALESVFAQADARAQAKGR